MANQTYKGRQNCFDCFLWEAFVNHIQPTESIGVLKDETEKISRMKMEKDKEPKIVFR